MNKLVIKKTLGFKDATHTFVVNTRQSDTNRDLMIQIVDDITLFDFSNVTTALLCYDNNIIDVTSYMNKENSSFIFPLCEIIHNAIGNLYCEIVLKDSKGINILTTNSFIIKIKSLGGDYHC